MKSKTNEEMLKQMKILYAEDDEQAREELVDVLKRRAGKVVAVENGRRGIEAFYEFEPDIIIADLYMPEIDGLEMVKKIREEGYSPSVVITSAVQDVDTIINAIDVGIVKYILKPVDLSELLDVLNTLAEKIFEKKHRTLAALPENKKQVEDEIKREFAAFLKTTTGKGPRNVNVFVDSNSIEIVATEVLTVFEKNLLDNFQNIAIIKYAREMFFSVKKDDICKLVERISGRRVSLKDVIISAEKDRNRLIFNIEKDM